MIRELGRAMRFPLVPAASRSAAPLAACPMQIVSMAGFTNCMVS